MRASICGGVLVLICSAAMGGDWPQFRGPNGSGVSTETGLPLTWSETENVAWKAELPGPGSSGPVVAGGRVYVTCYSGYGVDRADPGEPKSLTRHLLCFDLSDGKQLWKRDLPATVQEDEYRGMLADHGYASQTPAADGERVYVFLGKSGVAAFTRDGEPLWTTSVGTGSAIMGWGSGTSLTLHGDLVIVNANAESQSLIGLDKKTGKEAWKADAAGYQGSWSTPVIAEVGGKKELVVYMPGEVWGLDPADGGLLWYCPDVRGAATTSLIAADGIVYALGGGPRGAGATAIRAGGKDDVSKTHVLWKQPIGPYVPSPVLVGENIHWVDDRGTAVCISAKTGEQVYRERLPGAGSVYASTVAGDGKLYAVTRRNGTFILAAGPEFKVLAHNKIADDATDFNATPAISDGKLLLRSNKALYCIGTK